MVEVLHVEAVGELKSRYVAVSGQAAPLPMAPPPPCGGVTSFPFFCAACGEGFDTAEAFRMHSKSDRHVYNTKRKLSNLKPISQEAWDRKLREARAAAGSQNKGTAHLKTKDQKEKKTKDNNGTAPGDGSVEADTPTAASSVPVDEGPPSPRRSLFDRKHFDTVEECLKYMEKRYSFFLPDIEYCIDVPALLLFLREKMEEPPHLCICCQRPFQDLASLRRHMFDKCHTHLSSEVFTRRGNTDQESTELMQAELGQFYNYQSSVKEVMGRMNLQQRAAALLRYFDEDGDGLLNFEELGALWAAAENGAELTDAMYAGACSKAKADPARGLDATALRQLYQSGLADADAHFTMLQDRLSQSLKKGKSTEDDDDLPPLVEADAEEDGEEDDADEDSDSEFDVVECEDEDEFAEIMRVLGLEAVDITDTGDLRLPNGAVATHRNVSHIFRQRGRRMDAEQLASYKSGKRALGDRKAQLMLTNGSATGGVQMTSWQAKKEGKKVLAMLRHQSTMEVKLAVKQGMLQTNRIMKTRSVRGDASGAGGGGR